MRSFIINDLTTTNSQRDKGIDVFIPFILAQKDHPTVIREKGEAYTITIDTEKKVEDK